MTANQINYQKYLEDMRTHKMNEEISRRMASASESQAYASQLQAKAALANAAVNEASQRANQAYQEAMVLIQQKQQREAARHNAEMESLERLQTSYNYITNQNKISNDLLIAREKNETSIDIQASQNKAAMQRQLVQGGVSLITAFGNQATDVFTTLINTGGKLLSSLVPSNDRTSNRTSR